VICVNWSNAPSTFTFTQPCSGGSQHTEAHKELYLFFSYLLCSVYDRIAWLPFGSTFPTRGQHICSDSTQLSRKWTETSAGLSFSPCMTSFLTYQCTTEKISLDRKIVACCMLCDRLHYKNFSKVNPLQELECPFFRETLGWGSSTRWDWLQYVNVTEQLPLGANLKILYPAIVFEASHFFNWLRITLAILITIDLFLSVYLLNEDVC
jgi:hypothetical protein